MSEKLQSRVLVVGAGSMGIITGYHLQLAGASVTFLVRPHRVEALSRPQVLYSYDDNTLKEYNGYQYITDPSEITNAKYDYIVITLDAAALRNHVGQALVKSIGHAARGTNTKIVMGTIFINLLPWFLDLSGLPPSQVSNGYLTIHAYSTSAVTLPLHTPTDPELLAKSDVAYKHLMGQGFWLDDTVPDIAKGFAELWNKSGAAVATIKKKEELAVNMAPLFAVFAGCGVLGWPSFADLDIKGEIWELTIEAAKEIQTLGIHGELGQQAAKAMTAEAFAAQMKAFEMGMRPLDWIAFSKYHHGAKVNVQDRALLEACVEEGEREGREMKALKELNRRVEEKDGAE